MTLNDLTGTDLLEYAQKLMAANGETVERQQQKEHKKTDGFCHKCGKPLPDRVFTLEECDLDHHPLAVEGIVTICLPCDAPGCTAKRKNALQALNEQGEKAVKRDFEMRLEQAGLAMKGLAYDFGDFDTEWPVRKEHELALEEMHDKMTAWATNSGKGHVLISGPYGTGKTFIAVAATRYLLRHSRQSAFHFACLEGWEVVKSLWNAPKGTAGHYRGLNLTEADLVRKCQRSWFLIIDDLDKVKPSKGWLELMLGIVNYRVDRELPTIFTLNHPLKQVSAFLQNGTNGTADTAKALWSRIAGGVHKNGIYIQLPDGMPDYRRRGK